jgi:Zn-dependent protease with chaperone function
MHCSRKWPGGRSWLAGHLPPGAPIREAEHPRLFATIREVARQLEVEMPEVVYLTADINAFVVRAGGFLGLGGQRILGLGLGLLAVENLSQLRATLAHEFAHLKGRERLLSGLLRTTGALLLGLLHHLVLGGESRTQRPVEGLLSAYLGLTQALSRQQDLVADTWSMHVAGKQAHLTGLLQERFHAAGFSLFLEERYPPGLLREDTANVFEDYRCFLRSEDWKRLRPKVAETLAHEATDPYDAHPGLWERLAFAQELAIAEQPLDETPAYGLLSEVEALELRVSAQLWLQPFGCLLEQAASPP